MAVILALVALQQATSPTSGIIMGGGSDAAYSSSAVSDSSLILRGQPQPWDLVAGTETDHLGSPAEASQPALPLPGPQPKRSPASHPRHP